MIATIIGSLSCKEKIMRAKERLESMGCQVYTPLENQGERPLIAIQRNYIDRIEEADLIIAIPKSIIPEDISEKAQYLVEFGESTSYEMAIAGKLGKEVVMW